MKFLAVIPARGGSVRVPKKNIKLLGGKPLISYVITAAIKSEVFDRVIVSTDDEKIAKISFEYGAEVPFKRPPEISTDCESELVIKHAVEWLRDNENYQPDIVAMLQPTQPFITPYTIKYCAQVIHGKIKRGEKIDSIATVSNIGSNRPEWMTYIYGGRLSPYTTPFKDDCGKPIIKLVASQDFPELVRQNGVLYMVKTDTLLEEGLIIGHDCYGELCTDIEAFDLDTEFDFEIAEILLNKKITDYYNGIPINRKMI